jgi:16S rRNA (cytosine967-C5)-methyltransferase
LADAARAIASIVVEGRSSETALAAFESVPHRAAIRAIALGTVRWYLRLAPAIAPLLTRPKGVAPQLHALLVAAAHQIEYSRNAPQATVHVAVDAARILKEERATGLVNAVLRRFVTEKAILLAKVDEKLAARTAHPAWLVRRLAEAFPPEICAGILDANNGHPPMVLRVDLSRRERGQYLSELEAAGIAARPIDWLPSAVQLQAPVGLAELPGFSAGNVSVQDVGAQLAAWLLDARPGMRVLDACAAPGGKTGHLLERTSDLAELVAADVDAQRVERIRENLTRLKRTARVVVADVRDPATFWDGKPFDRILLDAPCSSTGVIRRHPDIKLLRRSDDIQALVKVQLEILRAAFGMLAVGGRLLYATCSVLPDENQQVFERFLGHEPAARAVAFADGVLPPGLLPQGPGPGPAVQLLPGAATGTDGFYYACVEKTTA